MNSETIRLVFVACLALPGALMAIMPWLTPEGEVFAVTVPRSAHKDPRIRRLRLAYATFMLALTALIVAPNIATPSDMTLFCALAALLPLAGIVAMLVCRRKVQAIKTQEGWHATEHRATAVTLPPEAPRPLPLTWNLLYVPIILVTVALLVMLYPTMPEQIPMHAGVGGEIDGWGSKYNLVDLAFPIIMQVFIAAVMTFCHVAIGRSKTGGQSPRPIAGALAYGRFAQLESVIVIGTGLTLTAGIGLIVPVYAGLLGLGAFGAIMIVISLVTVAACIGVSLWCGQSGTRLAGRVGAAANDVEDSSELPHDDDSCWKAGVFYWAPDDPSVFVPKRFGIGWTINLGNWRGRAVLAALVAATVAIVLVAVIAGS